MIRNKLGTDMILKTTRVTNVVRKLSLKILDFLRIIFKIELGYILLVNSKNIY